jgi:superoxide dismutase, Cu-Zn family
VFKGRTNRYRNSAPRILPGRSLNAGRPQSAMYAALAAAPLLLVGCQPNTPGEQDPGPRPNVSSDADARAELRPVPGQEVGGVVEFTAAAPGVEVHAQLTGLRPGRYGFHIHEVGDCSDPGTTAGEHFSPSDRPHGSPAAPPAARHAGDLGNIQADESGHAELRLDVAQLEIEGERGILGRSVVLHGGEDDFETQPDGDAGDPIACGVIRAARASFE